MATVNPNGSFRSSRRSHHLRNIVIALVAVAAVLVALFWHKLQTQALTATSYGARIACTCHYIEGRSLDNCRKDFEPGMTLVRLSDNPAQRTITARVPLVASQSAGFHEGAGCVLQRWAS